VRAVQRDWWSRGVLYVALGTLSLWGIWALLYETTRYPPLNYLIFGPFVGLPLAAALFVAGVIGYARSRVEDYATSDALGAILASIMLGVLSYLTIDAVGAFYS
jgi:hypothetical protein